ncbi:MAG: hypothetical protein KAJ48_06740 [Elusimicrobiales bacterium]|nr:hypothetical protein [Elusimicrobiales bacterium]
MDIPIPINPTNISIIVLVMVAVIVFVIFLSKKIKKDFDTLKTFLNGRIEDNFISIKFVGDYKGSHFEIKQIPGGKNSPPKLKLTMRTLRPLSVKIYKHSFIFSWGENLGLLSKSVKTGDMQFDKMFRVASSSDMNLFSFLSSVENRKLIQDLFESGYKSFKIKKGYIEIIKPYYNLENELKKENIIPALETLYKLALA